MKYIDTDKIAAPDGHYTQAIKVDDGYMYISGQLAFDLATSAIKGDIKEQTTLALNNIAEILKVEDYDKNDIVKVNLMLRNISDFPEVNKIYQSFFQDHKPARSTYAAKELPRNGLIEIDVVAFKKH